MAWLAALYPLCRPRPAAQRWLVTAGATLLSTYALDAVATAAGLALAAAQILQGLEPGLVLAFLAGTYLVWGAGLRVNLQANWALLEATGTSTNLLSKAAYDVVKRRTANRRTWRIAAAAAYGGTELAKETPYYAGALGAALVTDAVSASDALIFLGGANLGAAAYEYGLGRAVRGLLERRRTPAYASFEADWRPQAYLADYYRTVEADERQTIAFFVDAMKQCAPGEPILLFGVGPTLHHVFLAAGAASELHLADYLPANLQEIERWLARDADAHDWRPFVRYTLQCENRARPSEAAVAEREALTRARITRLLEVDIRRSDPLGGRGRAAYGTVISAYCVDSATAERAAWRTYMRRLAELVRPGGMLVVAALRRSRGYVVGGRTFPSADIDEHDLQAVLAPFFEPQDLTIAVGELGPSAAKGYASIVLARACRRRGAITP